jgi:glycosyltransferase involved in cell wall biosynthesis
MIQELSLILPVYNEGKVIRTVLTDVIAFLEETVPVYEIIVVDDGSRDDSFAIVREIAQGNRKVLPLRHEKNKGYGCALRSGFQAASLGYVFFMDADGQFTIEDLNLVMPFISDYDMVISYREKRNDRLFRNLLGATFTRIINTSFGLRYKDINCAFKLAKKKDIASLDLKIDGPLINAEMLIKAHKGNLTIKECAVSHLARLHGQPTGARITTIMRAFVEFLYLIAVCFAYRSRPYPEK